ncbi:MAG: hypothetical protein JWM80_1188 [Cyanobacteria bacterium RYN_339]|nr:hypothetical protein [Cyanobacteria bacterium RYN_339]
MSRQLLLPIFALALLGACTPSPGASTAASTAPSAATPRASATPLAGGTPIASATPVAGGTATSAYSASVSVDGKPLSINPNTESPLGTPDGSAGVRWAFGYSKQGGPADQAAVLLSMYGKEGTKLATLQTADIDYFKLQIVQNSSADTSWTVIAKPSADVKATIAGGALEIHLKGTSAVTNKPVVFDATGIKFR